MARPCNNVGVIDGEEALQALGARRHRRGRLVPPSLSTFRWVLQKLDG